MKAWIGAVALAGLSFSTVVMAEYDDSGAGLLRDCKSFVTPPATKSQMDLAHAYRCLGNMEGVIITLKRLSESKLTPPLLCPRNVKNMSNEIVARIIVKYLEDNPKELSNDRTSLVMSALLEAMPCEA